MSLECRSSTLLRDDEAPHGKIFPDMGGTSSFVTTIDAIQAERKKGISDAISVWKKRNKNDDTEPKLRARYYRTRQLMKNFAAALDALEDRAPSAQK